MSFSVKSSHKFINPPAHTESYFDSLSTSPSTSLSTSPVSTTSKKPVDPSKPDTNTDTSVKSSSTSGMAMRASQGALEDYY